MKYKLKRDNTNYLCTYKDDNKFRVYHGMPEHDSNRFNYFFSLKELYYIKHFIKITVGYNFIKHIEKEVHE